MKNTFYIRVFSDYHEIQDTEKFKSIELGCFPSKGGWCRNYFGLFYKGRKPKLERIRNSLCRKIDFDKNFCHGYTGENISVTKEMVFRKVQNALKNG